MIAYGFRSAARLLCFGEFMGKDYLFCKIIRGEKPAEFLYRDEPSGLFKDSYPDATIRFPADVVSLLSHPLKVASMFV